MVLSSSNSVDNLKSVLWEAYHEWWIFSHRAVHTHPKEGYSRLLEVLPGQSQKLQRVQTKENPCWRGLFQHFSEITLT